MSDRFIVNYILVAQSNNNVTSLKYDITFQLINHSFF